MERYQVMDILRQSENRGYPADYLTARIKGRSAYFLNNWDDLIMTPDLLEYLKQTHYGKFINAYSREGAWNRFSDETRWLYIQMNNGLREVFRPFFIYMELKTLMICFRFKLSEITGAKIENLLSFSLCSGKVKKTLIKGTDVLSVLEDFEKYLLFPSDDIEVLKESFLKDGLKGLERKLSALFLEGIMKSRLHEALRGFFSYIIDSKNVITAYKHIRWEVSAEPCFINGGTVGLSALAKCISGNDKSQIVRLVSRISGMVVEYINSSNIEKALQGGLTRRLKRMRIENDETGLILHYLWRCYIEAKNLSIILYGRDIDEQVLREEMVAG